MSIDLRSCDDNIELNQPGESVVSPLIKLLRRRQAKEIERQIIANDLSKFNMNNNKLGGVSNWSKISEKSNFVNRRRNLKSQDAPKESLLRLSLCSVPVSKNTKVGKLKCPSKHKIMMPKLSFTNLSKMTPVNPDTKFFKNYTAQNSLVSEHCDSEASKTTGGSQSKTVQALTKLLKQVPKTERGSMKIHKNGFLQRIARSKPVPKNSKFAPKQSETISTEGTIMKSSKSVKLLPSIIKKCTKQTKSPLNPSSKFCKKEDSKVTPNGEKCKVVEPDLLSSNTQFLLLVSCDY